MTNHQFAKTNETFVLACQSANLPATKRQASKFRRQMGLAYKTILRLAKERKE